MSWEAKANLVNMRIKGAFKMRKILALEIVMCSILISMLHTFGVAGAQEIVSPVPLTSSKVLWDQGIIEASGVGLPPKDAQTPAEKKVLARRAAITDAQRKLSEVVHTMRIEDGTSLSEVAGSNQTIRMKFSDIVRGAKIIRETVLPNGAYEVTMIVCIDGSKGLNEAVLGYGQIVNYRISRALYIKDALDPISIGVTSTVRNYHFKIDMTLPENTEITGIIVKPHNPHQEIYYDAGWDTRDVGKRMLRVIYKGKQISPFSMTTMGIYSGPVSFELLGNSSNYPQYKDFDVKVEFGDGTSNTAYVRMID